MPVVLPDRQAIAGLLDCKATRRHAIDLARARSEQPAVRRDRDQGSYIAMGGGRAEDV